MISEISKNCPQPLLQHIATPAEFLRSQGDFWICHNCHSLLGKGKQPPMSHSNNLQLLDIEGKDELQLSELENAMITLNIPFQIIYQLPKTRWTATKRQLVNIPIFESDVATTLTSLPRTPQEAGLIKVQLKRKKSMKNTHREQYVDAEKMFRALKTFQALGNPYYQGIANTIEDYYSRCQNTDPDNLFGTFHCHENPTDSDDGNDGNPNADANANDDDPSNSENATSSTKKADDTDDEEERYITQDAVQKQKFHVNRPTVMVNDYPEVDIRQDQQNWNDTDESTNGNNSIVIAPGEGKIPSNILQEIDWDIKSYPCLHPDGRNGYYEERPTKLPFQQYIQRRILNHDRRFANNSSYVFAAFAYNEQNVLQRNINVAYMRGKKTTTAGNVNIH